MRLQKLTFILSCTLLLSFPTVANAGFFADVWGAITGVFSSEESPNTHKNQGDIEVKRPTPIDNEDVDKNPIINIEINIDDGNGNIITNTIPIVNHEPILQVNKHSSYNDGQRASRNGDHPLKIQLVIQNIASLIEGFTPMLIDYPTFPLHLKADFESVPIEIPQGVAIEDLHFLFSKEQKMDVYLSDFTLSIIGEAFFIPLGQSVGKISLDGSKIDLSQAQYIIFTPHSDVQLLAIGTQTKVDNHYVDPLIIDDELATWTTLDTKQYVIVRDGGLDGFDIEDDGNKWVLFEELGEYIHTTSTHKIIWTIQPHKLYKTKAWYEEDELSLTEGGICADYGYGKGFGRDGEHVEACFYTYEGIASESAIGINYETEVK